MPALTRSRISSRSNCATAARMCNRSLLAGLDSSVSSPCEVAMHCFSVTTSRSRVMHQRSRRQPSGIGRRAIHGPRPYCAFTTMDSRASAFCIIVPLRRNLSGSSTGSARGAKFSNVRPGDVGNRMYHRNSLTSLCCGEAYTLCRIGQKCTQAFLPGCPPNTIRPMLSSAPRSCRDRGLGRSEYFGVTKP